MPSQESAVYCTVLLSDNYLPGAMVLAHSLRDTGTTAKLVALYTPEILLPETVAELATIYDTLIPVPTHTNTSTPANLSLLNRPDLLTTFTKVELWRQTQYSRIVYLDADVLALRAPDELLHLHLDHLNHTDTDTDTGQGDDNGGAVEFAAAPDVGWPDCFNSGVMVLRPDLGVYDELRRLAERGVSFDGADQGLLNMYFGNASSTSKQGSSEGEGKVWHRLSFGYNCTPSAGYQYEPAFEHYGGGVSLIHFIGGLKPWGLGRTGPGAGFGPRGGNEGSVYEKLLVRWWEVYDRNYSRKTIEQVSSDVSVGTLRRTPHEPLGMAKLHAGTTKTHHTVSDRDHEMVQTYRDEHHVVTPNPRSAVPQYVREEHVSTYLLHGTSPAIHVEEPPHETTADEVNTSTSITEEHSHAPPAEPVSESEATPSPPAPTFNPPMATWDASRYVEPINKPPEPKISTLTKPREPPPPNTRPEAITLQNQTYPMSTDTTLFHPPTSYPEAPKNMYYDVPRTKPEPERLARVFPWEGRAPRATRVFPNEQMSPSTTILGTENGTGSTFEAGGYGSGSGSVAPSTAANDNNSDGQGLTVVPTPRDEPHPAAVAAAGSGTGSGTTRNTRASKIYREIPKPTESFENYTRTNVWDGIPEIQRYVQSIEGARHAKKKKTTMTTTTAATAGQKTRHWERVRSQALPSSASAGNESNRAGGGGFGTLFDVDLALTPGIRTPVSGARGSARGLIPILDENNNDHRDYDDSDGGERGGKEIAATATEISALGTEVPVQCQEEWLSTTVDGFLHILQLASLYWRFVGGNREKERSRVVGVGDS